ncbi:class I SAM-dependent methyltransferase [Pedobacter antarcticus]|uniref:class I SAM-dependent methyltransferase n=1 Tax=Pedobacter antarcticus TaxID=34086 RepID=UPI002931EE61|nr:class I SAM-dependent methyltransferase [Pedobacter antarcticus]
MKRIAIFKTNIQQQNQADEVFITLTSILPSSRINFDLEDSDKILRIEDPDVDPDIIISVVQGLGFLCKSMPDKICKDPTNSADEMRTFWDSSFIEHEAMWGFQATNSAILAKDLFLGKDIKDILVPGIGYGRNAQVFMENNIKVTGIEISQAAIALAREHYSPDLEILHGSVTDMPFNDHLYDGIFCYGLVYLLNPDQRKKMINDCFNQLKPGGWMVFSVISVNSPNYGKGRKVRKDTFEVGKGAQVFFYDTNAVREEFGNYGLLDFFEIDEQTNAATHKPSFRFIIIKCKKEVEF